MRGGRQGYRTTRIPKEKQTIPVPAEGTEEGQFFSCWNCGFVCDSKKDALDSGRAGNSNELATLSPGKILGDPHSVRLRFGVPIVLNHLDCFGNRIPVYRERRVTVSSGCPFCGTHAWRD